MCGLISGRALISRWDLINKNEDKILRHSAFEFRKTRDHSQRIYVGNYIRMGIKNFIVLITSGKTYNVTEQEFVVMCSIMKP